MKNKLIVFFLYAFPVSVLMSVASLIFSFQGKSAEALHLSNTGSFFGVGANLVFGGILISTISFVTVVAQPKLRARNTANLFVIGILFLVAGASFSLRH